MSEKFDSYIDAVARGEGAQWARSQAPFWENLLLIVFVIVPWLLVGHY